jgi:predicted transcriptional regulator
MAPHPDDNPKTHIPVSLRLTSALAEAVRQIAEREETSQATILRRYVRRGVELERRSHDGNEAA